MSQLIEQLQVITTMFNRHELRFALIGGLALAAQDATDIATLVEKYRTSLNQTELAEYFEMFNRRDWYDQLLAP